MKAIARALLAGTLLLTGCAHPGTDPAPTATARPAAQFGGTDLAWIEINIAMDEELIPLLEIVPQHSGSPALQALARQMQGFTTAELNALRALHDQARLPSENPHKGMPMPGMVTPEQMTEASALTGKRFDAYVLKLLQSHLDQSKSLADSEGKSGVEPQTRALASQILRTRSLARGTFDKASKEAS